MCFSKAYSHFSSGLIAAVRLTERNCEIQLLLLPGLVQQRKTVLETASMEVAQTLALSLQQGAVFVVLSANCPRPAYWLIASGEASYMASQSRSEKQGAVWVL